MIKELLLLLTVLFLITCQPTVVEVPEVKQKKYSSVIPGIDNFLMNYSHLVKGKRIGLLTNPSGVNKDLHATSDLLFEDERIHLVALFGPEHGVRGAIYAGEKVNTSTDKKTGLPVYSLYGRTRMPTAEMLENVDIVIVDIQDIGIRAYTYIYTMAKVMEAAADFGKKVIVLDRPNPLGGIWIEGNLVQEGFSSFVGLYPITYLHGMTIGELALFFNTEYNINCQLDVVPMLGWRREMLWGDTGLHWVPTSPHVPHWLTIFYMGATGTFGELGTLSEGVGYTSPFEIVGAPWIDAQVFSDNLNRLNLPGIYFRPIYFKPYYAHYAGQNCQGVQLHITNPQIFKPYTTGLHIMQVHMKLYPEQNLFSRENRVKMFDKVVGTDNIRESLIANKTIEEIERSWLPEINSFKATRKKYLLYN